MGAAAGFAYGGFVAACATFYIAGVGALVGGPVGAFMYGFDEAQKGAETGVNLAKLWRYKSNLKESIQGVQKSVAELGVAIEEAIKTKESLQLSTEVNTLNTNRPR